MPNLALLKLSTVKVKNLRKLRKFDDFYKLSNVFFKTIGTIPYAEWEILNLKPTLALSIFFYVCIINLNLNVVADAAYVMWAFVQADLFVEAVTGSCYVGFIVSSEIKVLCLWWQRRTLIHLMQQLYERFPTTLKEQRVYKLEKFFKQCKLISASYATLYMVLIIIYNFYVLLQYAIIECWLGWRVVGLPVPYLQLLPWNYEDNWTYYAVYVYQVLGGYTAAAQVVACDILLVALILQIIMHYDYISVAISTYQTQLAPGAVPSLVKDMEFVRQIAAYHMQLLSMSNAMNLVFGLPLLMNFMISSCVICFLAFQMTIDVPIDVLLKLMIFLISSLTQVFMICHLGQRLTDASAAVFDAVCTPYWVQADKRLQKMLLILGERSKQPFQLKATQFILISAETFTMIMQASYKFFTLLRTLYGD